MPTPDSMPTPTGYNKSDVTPSEEVIPTPDDNTDDFGYDKTDDDDKKPDGWYLEDLVQGEQFLFNSRHFKKLETKRTRAVCLDVNSGRTYLITESAMVKKI